YIDPPFATKSDFGGSNGERSYSDKVATAEFIEALRERLIYLRELLADDGSIYVHLDLRMTHYVKIVMDEVFGRNCFRNEVTWRRQIVRGRKVEARYMPNSADFLTLYSRTENAIWNAIKKITYISLEEADAKYMKDAQGYFRTSDPGTYSNQSLIKLYNEGRLYVTKGGEVIFQNGVLKTTKGSIGIKYYREKVGNKVKEETVADNIWDDIPGMGIVSSEYLGYPTQKPEALLERVVLASSNPGDLVMDCFAGSGTTAAVAEKLGRRWIACDFGKHAIYTMQKRMLRIGESKALQDEEDQYGKTVVKKGSPYGKPPKPFCVVSAGAYDFSHVMDLRKNRETYTDFVLGLFQLSRDEDRIQKFRLANIHATKDGDPVEVYPVWDDEYLKNVRVDEDYLRGIVQQAGGSLRGNYYIIAPETCSNVGDTTIQNPGGKEVNFNILTFPYKVLEDVSRNLVLQEQPGSQSQVNELITSTAFYFNEDVEITVERAGKGLRVSSFNSRILDGQGDRYKGLSGLAMILIDLDYEPGKPFDMDATVFANDISGDGTFAVDGLTSSIGIIAIDRHGNESKPQRV
ncbi:MAG: site-specific DNA-methyltransferase, partial [Synergistales bacterium]|nr:site-specific DNA-methyltransferase [Synergistales bacterium]